MRFLIYLFTFLLSAISVANAQTYLFGSGSLNALKAKIQNFDANQLKAIQAVYPDATLKNLVNSMQETAFLKDGEKYIPPIEEPHNGCVGGATGRGFGYLFYKKEDFNLEYYGLPEQGSEIGQDFTYLMLNDLILEEKYTPDDPKTKKIDGGTYGTPHDWIKSKNKITKQMSDRMGGNVENYAFDFPNQAGTISNNNSTNYTQPSNIQSALDMIGKAMKNGEAVEIRINSGQGCGESTPFHFALAYRMVSFKGFDGLYGISIVDDGKPDGSNDNVGQGDGIPYNYERGLYLFDKEGNCLNQKGLRITHFMIEKLKDER